MIEERKKETKKLLKIYLFIFLSASVSEMNVLNGNLKSFLKTKIRCEEIYYSTSQLRRKIFITRWPHQWRSGRAWNWKTRGARFKPRLRLSTQTFRVFCGFLRKSRKYGLGFLGKTPTEGTPPTSGSFSLNLQPNHTTYNPLKHF